MPEKKKTILIVEDEKPIANALHLKLEHSGFITVVAYNGEEGLELLKKGGIDLVVLDLIMPKMNGFDFLEKNKVKVPVFVLSNLSQNDDEDRVKKLGAAAFFIKSNVQISSVVDEINKQFRK